MTTSTQSHSPPLQLQLRHPKRLSKPGLVFFFRKLATMTQAGIPIHRALRFNAQSTDGIESALSTDLADRVEQHGVPLSTAMRRHPCFSPIHIALISAGEKTGGLVKILQKLANMTEKDHALRSKLINSLTYPMFLVLTSLGIFALFLSFVVPRLNEVFTTLQVPMPMLTIVMIKTGSLVTSPYFIGGVLFFTLTMWWYAVKIQRLNLFSLVQSIPILGPLFYKVTAARVLYTLALTLESGLNLSPAIWNTIAGLIELPSVKSGFIDSRQAVFEGEALSEAWLKNRVFPKMICQLIAVGEEAGELDTMLHKAAAMLEDEINHSILTLTSLLEPLLLACMGVGVGILALAIALPALNLSSAL